MYMTALIRNIFHASMIMLIVGSSAKCNPSKDDIASYYGTWTVKKYKWGNAISAFDDEQASKYINKQVLIMNHKAIIFGDECSTPSFSIRTEDKSDLLYKEYRESDFSIISADTVTVIDVKCTSTPIYRNPDSLNFSTTMFIINEQEMIIPINGAYLYLEKEKLKERELSFKEFNGTGSFKQRVDLNSCNTGIKIEYNFYNIADRIILEDANGNVFFSTEMETTSGMKTVTTDAKLATKDQCYFYLRVESSQKERSKWELKVALSEY